MTQKIAIYPGTFDPITFGHLDVIKRALNIVDKLIIGVAVDNAKDPLFSLEKRIELAKKEVEIFNQNNKKVEVVGFRGLLVEFARNNKSNLIIRGLRAVSDFEYEFQMSGMNSKLDPEIQTIFLPASETTHFTASRMVKEIARLGGDVSSFVSENIRKELFVVFESKNA